VNEKAYRVFKVEGRALEPGNAYVKVTMHTLTGIKMSRMLNFTVYTLSSNFSFEPSSVHGGSFNVSIENRGPSVVLSFKSMNNVSFNITNLPDDTVELGTNQSVELHFIVLGNTVIMAVAPHSYEVALLQVTVET
jgi:hypothetical protein